MEDVVHPLDYVSHDLLEVLNLHVAVQHQQGVRDRHVYTFNCVVLGLASGVAVLFGWAGAEVVLVALRNRVRSLDHDLVRHRSV